MKIIQKEVFRNGEAAQWYERNKDKYNPSDDLVLQVIKEYDIIPNSYSYLSHTSILEVGCSVGYRLGALREYYNYRITKNNYFYSGIDPGIHHGIERMDSLDGCWIEYGTADKLPLNNKSVGLLIFGFCLYLCDPIDYFYIAAEADRVLRPGAFMIIEDLPRPTGRKTFFRVPYKHKPGVFSYHFNFSRLWSWNPNYRVIHKYEKTKIDPERMRQVTVLQKKKECP